MTRDPSTLAAAARAIEDSETLALACHVGPDGDALGSMLGFAVAARDAGKEVVASFGSPFDLPSGLEFLPADLLVPPKEFPSDPETMVVFDVGSAERIGELASNAGRAGTVVVIDHHVTNEGFGDVALIDHEAAATGELVYELLGALRWQLSPQIAQCLLTALVTDTGRFQYSNTRPRTLEIAAELIAAGAEPAVIGRHVYEEAPFGYLKASAIALGRAELHADLGVVSTILTQSDLDTAGLSWADTDNLIDLLRLPVEADTAVLVKGHDDGRVKVSLRSRGATDVGSLAAAMGGGGHRLAAGFTSDGQPEDVRRKVLDSVEDYR
ncbi:MAG TPA: bifunctional oligoribonuclease/PAP phosphatase NrnA [Acidimicrobiia bacterium]|nr:bifunctional oligoribonuclease/PAP phosphatase NrnA [Acidimicrobiia bacterium]